MSDQRTVYIYGLVDPREPEEIRYVGKTIDPRKRLKGHERYSRNGGTFPVNYWIRKLQKESVAPVLEILEECTGWDWIEREQHHVAYWRIASNKKLMNATDGGEGVKGYQPSEKERKAASERLKKMWKDPEMRGRLSESRRRMWKDPDFRERGSNVMREKWKDPEYRERLLESQERRWEKPEERDKAAEKQRENWKDPEYRERATRAANEQWADPKKRQKAAERQRERWKDPEYRENVTGKAKEQWEDPKCRQSVSEGMKKKWNEPSYRKNQKKKARINAAEKMGITYEEFQELPRRIVEMRNDNMSVRKICEALSIGAKAYRNYIRIAKEELGLVVSIDDKRARQIAAAERMGFTYKEYQELVVRVVEMRNDGVLVEEIRKELKITRRIYRSCIKNAKEELGLSVRTDRKKRAWERRNKDKALEVQKLHRQGVKQKNIRERLSIGCKKTCKKLLAYANEINPLETSQGNKDVEESKS